MLLVDSPDLDMASKTDGADVGACRQMSIWADVAVNLMQGFQDKKQNPSQEHSC